MGVFPRFCNPSRVQPNRGWHVLLQPDPAPSLVLLCLALLVAAQRALLGHPRIHLEGPTFIVRRVGTRRSLLRFAYGPHGPLDNQRGSRLICPPHVDKPPSWDLLNPTCLTLAGK